MPLGHRSARRRGMLMGAAVASSRGRKQTASASPAPAPSPAPADQASNSADSIAQLEKLAELRDKGILTEEEFSAKKKQLLGL